MHALLIQISNSPNLLEQYANVANVLIGITAVVSLWISIKALRRADWNSALQTAPSIILRPKRIYVGIRNPNEGGYGVIDRGEKILHQENDSRLIVFHIEFSAHNYGRGSAFNIKKPEISGEVRYEEGNNPIPLHQTPEDESFVFSIDIERNFSEWHKNIRKEIPVKIELFYTNDQRNVACTSVWSSKLRPFDIDGDDLLVRETRLLDRDGEISYKPYGKEK